MKNFTSAECKVINQNKIKLADSLATLATKPVLKKEKLTLQIEKKKNRFDQERVMSPRRLARGSFEGYDPGRDIGLSLLRKMMNFLKISGYFFFEGSEGILMKCILRQKGLT